MARTHTYAELVMMESLALRAAPKSAERRRRMAVLNRAVAQYAAAEGLTCDGKVVRAADGGVWHPTPTDRWYGVSDRLRAVALHPTAHGVWKF